MNKLFWGFFLLFLNFHLSFNANTLQLLPDWLGFILLYLACAELRSESELFGKPQPFCIGLAIYDATFWLLDFLAINVQLGILGWALRLAALCLRLYVTLLVVKAIANMEMRRNADLGSAWLRRVWTVLAAASIAACLLTLIPALAILGAITAGIAGIVFLVAVHKTRKAYRQMLSDYRQDF